jgi:D-alanyl-lipoteichoic acid acyltransferase DltB (MBOAT superfamily)
MLFNSFDFLIFILIVFPLAWILRGRPRIYFLLFASYFFYGYWKWQYTSLLMLTTIIDYLAGILLGRTPDPIKRKIYLGVSLSVNLGILAIFKYYNFFASSIGSWFGWTAIPLNVLLPVGVSFYTFQSMSYTIDVYRGVLNPCRNFADFALYVAFFPQLVAGPIVRAIDFLPQLANKPAFDWAHFRSGMHLVVRGLIEKVVIADNLAPIVERVYSNPSAHSGIDLWIGTYCFAFQIFADFAGYTDIARGIARMLGYEFLENFRRPYVALNITDFWRRWHISLSTWLRDYLYIPLGGSRKGKFRTYLNLMITMVLGGLWHGANWTFLWWGFFHGTLLTIQHAFGRKPEEEQGSRPVINTIRALLTFHLVCIGWVFFRAPEVTIAWQMLQQMFSPSLLAAGATLAPYALLCGILYLVMVADEFLATGKWFERLPLPARVLVLFACFLLLVLFQPQRGVAFIYFQF